MPIYTHQYIKNQASAVIEQFGITDPPVDVGGIAEKLDIEVVEMSTEGWFHSMLTQHNESLYIVINKMMSATRKRFAIAHEIGHYQLHNHDLGYQRSSDKEHYHREADVFALELCIPTHLIMREAHNWFNDHKFLANLFGVSEAMMVKKMEELKLISKGKFNWKYVDWKAV